MRLGIAPALIDHDAVLRQSGAMRVCLHPRIGRCGVPRGAAVENTLPPMFCDVAGNDPAGSNACEGGAGNEGGSGRPFFPSNCSAALALSIGAITLRIIHK